EKRRATSLGVVGRLADDVGLERAEAEMRGIASRLAEEYPDDNKSRNVALVPLLQTSVHPDERGIYVRAGALLASMVGLVLLIACANVANMLLVRASGRRREIAVRLALGAPRGRLIRQLLTESLVLALLAGALGLLIAAWAQRLIAAFQIPFLPETLDFGLDGRVLAFTLGLSLLTGFLFGLVPALQSSRPSLVPALKQGADASPGSPGRKLGLRQILVAAQVSLSLVALIAALLFLRSLTNAQRIEPGFDRERLLLVSFNLDNLGYDEPRGEALLTGLVERVKSLPGVRSAAVGENLALYDSGLYRTATIEGQSEEDGPVIAQTNSVDSGYFETMGIRILQGRPFTEADRSGVKRVAIVNKTMAEEGWPGQNPVGRRLRLKPTDDVFEVVGVAADIKYNTLGEDPKSYLYMPIQQTYSPAVTLHVRTSGAPADLAGDVRGVVREMAPGLPAPEVQTMDDVIDALLWAPRAGATLLTVFGTVALLLALIGIYGVTSYLVSQRRREIGIRMALGARRSDVLRFFLGRGMAVVAAGLVIGLLSALALSRLAASLLFGIQARDPLAFGAAALVLALTALLANYVPARRAAAVPPVEVIRQQ
ncbi:MAG TPA: ADOP family duplicated permease, partial [Thermoanaerobaculia bacterium]|nr:ADOP family duplicated permease [Thermoanaerobaculia bacterium]